MFSYVLCAVCPVKQTKPCLSYSASENDFHALDPDWVVASPDMGFLFPAFLVLQLALFGYLFAQV